MDPTTDPYLASHPDSTPRLNAALAKAQGLVEAAKKDSKNPAFLRDGKPSTYADLASVLGAIREAFALCEIAYPQTTLCEEGHVTVYTHLRHSSGEAMVSPFRVPVTKKDPQGFGSATTYARRFGLMAAAGVAPDDDDGNEHALAKPDTKPPKKSEPKPVDTSKLVAAFAGLGVTLASLEERISKPIAQATDADVVSLRAHFAATKKLATETADVKAARIEAEKAEAGIAAEQASKTASAEMRAQIDARMAQLAAEDSPVKADAVSAVKVFAAFAERIKTATTPGNAALVVAEAAGAKLTAGDMKALQRAAQDRTFILNDAAKQKTRKLEIHDAPEPF